jgi:hypothetical protein
MNTKSKVEYRARVEATGQRTDERSSAPSLKSAHFQANGEAATGTAQQHPDDPAARTARRKYAMIANWCKITGMSRTGTYEAIGRGDMRAIKLGARTLIDVEHGLAWMDALPQAPIAAPKS